MRENIRSHAPNVKSVLYTSTGGDPKLFMPGGWDKNVSMSEEEETAPHGLGDWHNLLGRIVQIRPVSLQTHLWPRKLNFCRIQKKAFAFLVYYYVSLLLLRVCAMTRDAYHIVAAKKWLSAKRWFPVFTQKVTFRI